MSEQRCPDCGQLQYEDGRSGVFKHYLNDLSQCGGLLRPLPTPTQEARR